MAIIKASGVPELFVWLSLQSLVVVTTAIWFRSRFIVIANFLIYVAIVIIIAIFITAAYANSRTMLARIAPTERCRPTSWPCVATAEVPFLRGIVHDPTARRMGRVAGHAGLFSTAADLSRFCRMLLNGGSLDGAQILSPTALKPNRSVTLLLPFGGRSLRCVGKVVWARLEASSDAMRYRGGIYFTSVDAAAIEEFVTRVAPSAL